MNSYTATFTPLAPAQFNIPNGFQAKYMKVVVMRPGAYIAESSSEVDETNYIFGWWKFDDNVVKSQGDFYGTTELVRYREKVGSTITDVNKAVFDTSLGDGFFATSTKFTVTSVTNAAQYKVTLLG